MNDYVIALFGTLMVYVWIQTIKSFMRMNLFKKIKNRILVLTTLYVVEHAREGFIGYQYRNFIYRKLEEEELRQWVERVDVRWINETRFVLSLDMLYNNNLRMKYEFPMDMTQMTRTSMKDKE
ncbi:MAG: hypothetical protein AVO33_03620 [delta proteobacterium ML8_F1]|nr:MAG: hypothetical protein AVO33_03620 [delta proteobacterium ML8_F1]